MKNDITIPETFLLCKLTIVAVRTQMIMEIKHLNDEQRRVVIDDMISRQMEDIRLYAGMD